MHATLGESQICVLVSDVLGALEPPTQFGLCSSVQSTIALANFLIDVECHSASLVYIVQSDRLGFSWVVPRHGEY